MAGKKEGSGLLAPVENIYMPIVSAVPLSQMKAWAYAYFHPGDACAQNKKDANIGGIAVHLVLIGLLGWVATMLMYAVGLNFAAFGIGMFGIVGSPIFALIAGFIGSAVYWVVAKIFGGKGGYMEQTLALALLFGGYTVVAFPFTVLSGIIGIGAIFGLVATLLSLYNLYNLYLVTKAVHSLSSAKAAIVVLIPIILAVLLAFVFAAAMVTMLGAGALGAAAGNKLPGY